MNEQELRQAIAKFNYRAVKLRLSLYGAAISTFLLLSTLGSGFSLTTLTSFLLVLPIPVYFYLQSFKLSQKMRRLKANYHGLQSTVYDLRSKFSLTQFLTQPSFTFRLSLLLFFLVCLTALARTTTPDPTLSLNTHPFAVDR